MNLGPLLLGFQGRNQPENVRIRSAKRLGYCTASHALRAQLKHGSAVLRSLPVDLLMREKQNARNNRSSRLKLGRT
jgi:hypothetical protein